MHVKSMSVGCLIAVMVCANALAGEAREVHVLEVELRISEGVSVPTEAKVNHVTNLMWAGDVIGQAARTEDGHRIYKSSALVQQARERRRAVVVTSPQQDAQVFVIEDLAKLKPGAEWSEWSNPTYVERDQPQGPGPMLRFMQGLDAKNRRVEVPQGSFEMHYRVVEK